MKTRTELGQTQAHRTLPALDPASAPLDARSIKTLYAQSAALASYVNYVNPDTNAVDGDWQSFFQTPPEAIEALWENGGFTEPQLALFLAFLKHYQYLQSDLNQITARHLDYYYRTVLGITPTPAIPDQVHVAMALLPNAPAVLVPKGTALLAGKDARGKPLRYQVLRDTLISSVQVTDLKSICEAGTANWYAAPAANSLDGVGKPLSPTAPDWPAFGAAAFPLGEQGVAISSPLLHLKSGNRYIVLILGVNEIQDPPADYFTAFQAVLSEETGWSAPVTTYSLISKNALYILITVKAEAPAITGCQPALHGGGYPREVPVIKLQFHPAVSPAIRKLIQALTCSTFQVVVSAEAVTDFSLENDLGRLDPKKPFMPFGPEARAGAGFTIFCPEAAAKGALSYSLKFTWQQPPASLSSHYSEYQKNGAAIVPANSHFTARVTLGSTVESRALFQDNAAVPKTLLAKSEDSNPGDSIIRLRLNYGFLTDEYRNLVTQKMVQFAHTDGKGDLGLPNKPYIPVAESFSLNYVVDSGVINPGQAADSAALFHVLPFGCEKWVGPREIIPRLNGAGALYVGLEKAVPGQTLNLWFQVAEGTANPDITTPLAWDILTQSGWQPLASAIAEDTTLGLRKSGIVQINLPDSLWLESTELPPGKTWLRVSALSDPAGVCRLLFVSANALCAEFQESGNDPAHYAAPLAANSIKKLAAAVSGIQSVLQPYPSFGARPAEQALTYYTRVSERLRHRNRAVTTWDYERLVLNQFPDIHQVKVIAHCSPESVLMPGAVTVVVVPDLSAKQGALALRPKVDSDRLVAIADYLKARGCSWSSLYVQNPSYEPIWVSCQVAFYRDPTYFCGLLNQELQQYLSPWTKAMAAELPFGNQMHAAAVLQFIENRPYVDYVADFKLFHHNVETELAVAHDPRAILVSADQHLINQLGDL